MIDEQIDAGDRPSSSPTTTARPASPSSPATALGVEFDARDFRGDFEDAPQGSAREGHQRTSPTVDPGADRGEPQPGRGPEGLEVERTDAGR